MRRLQVAMLFHRASKPYPAVLARVRCITDCYAAIPRGRLVQEARDGRQAPVLCNHPEVGAMCRGRSTRSSKGPGKAYPVAIPVGLTPQREAMTGETLMHGADQSTVSCSTASALQCMGST